MKEFKILHSENDSISTNEVAEVIQELDKNFIYPLKERPEFRSYAYYAEKFLNKGCIVFCRTEDKTLMGFTTFYADPVNFEYAYIPYTGILPEHQGKGLAKSLLSKRNKMIKDIGMKGILSTCSVKNERMISLLKKSGYFRITDQDDIKKLKEWNPKDDWNKAFFKLIFS